MKDLPNYDSRSDNLLSKTTLEMKQMVNSFIICRMVGVESLLTDLKMLVDVSFNSKDEDVEDSGDLLILITKLLISMISNTELYTDSQICEMIEFRIYAKKQVKYKYRKGVKLCTTDGSSNEQFWNYEDAKIQYRLFMIHQWKPNLKIIVDLVTEHRPNIVFID